MAGVREAIEVEPDRRMAPPAAGTEDRWFPRGAIVVVHDGSRFHARIVAVIGVVAVVARRRDGAVDEACRAVPVRCCQPAGDAPPCPASAGTAEPATGRPAGGPGSSPAARPPA